MDKKKANAQKGMVDSEAAEGEDDKKVMSSQKHVEPNDTHTKTVTLAMNSHNCRSNSKT